MLEHLIGKEVKVRLYYGSGNFNDVTGILDSIENALVTLMIEERDFMVINIRSLAFVMLGNRF